jgi:uncharacterized protein (TIGR02266 family)
LKARVLVAGVDRALYDRLEPLLRRSDLEVDRVPRGASALLLSQHATFDLIAVQHPLPDLALDEFVASLRSRSAASAASPLLVLCDGPRLGEAKRMLGDGPGEVLPADEPWRLMEQVAARLLGVAPRRRTRLMVRLETVLSTERNRIMCQAENVSEGGLLVRTDKMHPVGTRLAFEFQPPSERSPITGEADVVRHAVPEIERVQGLGLRFVSFRGDSQKRLLDYLRQESAS